MGVELELQNFLGACKRIFREQSPGVEYLLSRGYSFGSLQEFGLGYYRGSTAVPIEDKNLRGCLWHWGEGKQAVVYPLRTMGGTLLGFQLGALHPGNYEDFFSQGAGKRGVFFYPDTFDWESFHRTGKVVLVEGCLDALALSLHLRCVLSCLSARVTRGQSRGLERWASEIYCCFDRDETGVNAAGKFERFWSKDHPVAWKLKHTVVHQVSSVKRKDPQAMLEIDPGHFRHWIRSWAPKDLQRGGA